MNNTINVRIDNCDCTIKYSRYENPQLVGKSGANGFVVKAKHIVTQRYDAIKVWKPNKTTTVDESQYLEEVKKLASITKHNNIATLYDAWMEDGFYYCSMEYIDGITLKEWIAENHSLEKRLALLVQLFETVKYYHSKGIIHGDIHTKNILVDVRDSIHIIDFGTSVNSWYNNQSVDRENYLLWDLANKLLPEADICNSLCLNSFKIPGKIYVETKGGEFVNPLLLSDSLLQLTYLIRMKYSVGTLEKEDLIEYCTYITNGYYIDESYFYRDMHSWVNENVTKCFSRVYEELFAPFEDFENRFNRNDIIIAAFSVCFSEVKKRGIIDQLKNVNIDINIDIEKLIDCLLNSPDYETFYKKANEDLSDSFENYYDVINKLRIAMYAILIKSTEENDKYRNYLYNLVRLKLEANELE